MKRHINTLLALLSCLSLVACCIIVMCNVAGSHILLSIGAAALAAFLLWRFAVQARRCRRNGRSLASVFYGGIATDIALLVLVPIFMAGIDNEKWEPLFCVIVLWLVIDVARLLLDRLSSD